MNLKQSKRQNVKLRLGISGASGFGKTHSALLLAYGMTNDWSRIAVIDTENSSASLYANLGSFNVLDLKAPYSPERYIEAIEVCEKSENIEIIIIDSISQEWNGKGGCLDIHAKLGSKFQDWAKVGARHQAFIDKILQSNCHVITTTRRKVDYSLNVGSNGRMQVVKHGTKEITRSGYEYELVVNFELINNQNECKVSKDRTNLFSKSEQFIITSKTGEKLLKWCYAKPVVAQDVIDMINGAVSISELSDIYKEYTSFQQCLQSQFVNKKEQLEKLINPNNFSKNGVGNIVESH